MIKVSVEEVNKCHIDKQMQIQAISIVPANLDLHPLIIIADRSFMVLVGAM